MAINFGNTDAQLTNAVSVIFTAGASSSYLITRLTAVNTDTSPHGITLYRVFNGGTPMTSNEVVNPTNWPGLIPAGEMVAIPLTGHSFSNGQSLQGLADASGFVNLSVSYIQQDNS